MVIQPPDVQNQTLTS